MGLFITAAIHVHARSAGVARKGGANAGQNLSRTKPIPAAGDGARCAGGYDIFVAATGAEAAGLLLGRSKIS